MRLKQVAALLLPVVMVGNVSQAQTSQAAAAEPRVMPKLVASEAVETQSATQNTIVLSREQMDDQQVTDMEDLVRYIPGVEVSDLGRFGANGFNIRGLDGDQVSMSIDGLSFGETLDPASYQPYDFLRTTRGGLDTDALKSVEIVKGADSVTLGSGGLSGGVLFITKDAADYLKTHVNGRGNDLYLGAKAAYASANDETGFTGTFAGRLGRWESLLVATKREGHEQEVQGSGADITGAAREIPDPLDADSLSVLFKLANHVTDTQRVGLVAEYYSATSQLNNLSRVNASYLTRTSDDEQSRKRMGLNYEWQGRTWFDSLTASYDFQGMESVGYTKMLFLSSTCPSGVSPCYRSEDRYYDQDTHTLKLRFNKLLSGDAVTQVLLYGVGSEQRDVSFSSIDTRYVGATNTVGTIEEDADFVPETRARNFNVYLRDEIDLANQPWRFRLGGRFDRYSYAPSFNAQYQDDSGTVSDVSFSAFTWQSGVDFKLAPAHTLSLQVGTGFRAPSTENLYYATVTTPGTGSSGNPIVLWDSVANPDLKAEKSLNTELAYAWKGNRQQLTLAVFRDKYSNFIETKTLSRVVDGVTDDYTTTVNTGEVIVKGVEVSGRWAFNDALGLRLAYSYNEGEKQNGDSLLSIVPASGVVGLEYQGFGRRLAAALNVTHADAKKREDTLQTDDAGATTSGASFVTDAYTVVDLLARYQVTPAWKLTAGIYNLLDEQYWRWSRVRFVSEGVGGARGGVSGNGLNRYAESGRNFKASVSYSF